VKGTVYGIVDGGNGLKYEQLENISLENITSG